MKTYKIAVIGGDGIGPEVLTEGTCLTPDMGGTATTQQVGDRVAELI